MHCLGLLPAAEHVIDRERIYLRKMADDLLASGSPLAKSVIQAADVKN